MSTHPDSIDMDDYDADDYADDVDLTPAASEAEVLEPVRAPRPNREQRRRAEREERRRAPEPSVAAPGQVTPLEREAKGIRMQGVEYDGETYWVAADPEYWDPEAVLAFERNKAMTALEYILEDDGFEKLLRIKRQRGYRMKQIIELFDLVGKTAGFESAGN